MKATNLICVALLGALVTACASTPAGTRAGSPSEAPGSTSNSVVAVPDPGKLVYFAGRLSEEELAELSGLAPNVQIEAGLEREELVRRAEEADGADAHLCSSEFLRVAKNLRWAQAWSAGVDRYVARDELVTNDRLVLTNMQGVHGPAIADHVMAMLLSLTRQLSTWRDAMREGNWDRGLSGDMSALQGRTMFVVGLGGIGSEVAIRAKGFGMRVVATVRSEREPPEFVDELYLAEDMDQLLPTADVVAICVPLTDETRGMFDRERIARMKRGAYVINIARGPVIDTDALLAALEEGRLAGACLDVTDPEPLPADHPLWTRDDVLITPHVAGRAEVTLERRWALFRENMRRFGAGEPLLNVVDKRAGY
jgi:phosphoglycerate dehydrogenase-like enzyme